MPYTNAGEPRRLQADCGLRHKTHDNPLSSGPERRTVLVGRELARYKVDIAVLSETQFSEQGQLGEVGASYTFFWSGRPKAERWDAGVTFTTRNDIVGRLPCLSQGINDRLLRLRRLSAKANSPPSAASTFLDDQTSRREEQILRGPARTPDDCVEDG
ncbi:hypothetical protein SprV_0501934200 [Sparganum proliferum]